MNCGPLNIEDFLDVENVSFPPKGNNVPPQITPPHSLAHTFKFKSYSPKIFHKIREFFDIDSESYMKSVCGKVFSFQYSYLLKLIPCI